MGHCSLLHDVLCSSSPTQSSPRKFFCVATVRNLFVVPGVPSLVQLMLHSAHCVQSESWQCTGHTPLSHVLFSDTEPHFSPPKAGSVSALRALRVAPVPQVTSQGSQGCQSSMTQSTGQAFMPHPSVCRFCPIHSLPTAFFIWAKLRYLDRCPSPQDLEQPSQSPQSLHLQSTGQTLSWHSAAALEFPEQALPPYCSDRFCARVFTLVPIPQVAEHVPQGDHSSQAQSTGQGL
mmetsp:Transcript_6922/g.16447  ORF Transcript_6922/g.16447 Transcript_6922/m.16447 type:complete len:233 (+) Transcript_6922:2637-3335(+)